MHQTHTALFVPVGKPEPTSSASEEFLTGPQIEQVFKISASHRLYLDSLGMPHISIGGKGGKGGNRRRYLRSEVEQFLRSRDSRQEST
jgi:hypothetical protein